MPLPARRRIPRRLFGPSNLGASLDPLRPSLRGSAARGGCDRSLPARARPAAGARSGAGRTRRGPRRARRRGRHRACGARSRHRRPGPRAGRAFARSPVQPHRDGAAHQPRARAAAGGRRRGDGRGGPRREQPRIRRGHRTARGPAPARRAAAAPAHLGRGGDRRQQQRRRGAAGPRYLRETQGGPGLAGGADRDRGRVPDPRHHEAGGRDSSRSAPRTVRISATTRRRSGRGLLY